ncbi:hypothetical protein F3Y22_tig00113725pilonHSYRG00187 [Hibiscus syriacus]|uniref:Pentatricopeptide repeat-containing protein n=1 Tax=Hibiscus syriacus TaxID=106335 RepID=A0A6A2WN09_HIBSY|nr:hypothetical protein F3Y22_tig00113725pilonHSYRG00187 [Hibiscus syriacus]
MQALQPSSLRASSLNDLKKVHAQLIKIGLVKDIIAASRVLAFSASPAGDINYASSLFARMEHPNLFARNIVIRAFSRSSNPEKLHLSSPSFII